MMQGQTGVLNEVAEDRCIQAYMRAALFCVTCL